MSGGFKLSEHWFQAQLGRVDQEIIDPVFARDILRVVLKDLVRLLFKHVDALLISNAEVLQQELRRIVLNLRNAVVTNT